MGSSQKPKEGWWRWNLGSPVDLLGAGGNQKQTGVLMRCYLICDWYKTLSNWSVLWERWLAGTAVTRSDVCWCVPAPSMTFLKMKARGTEICHVEQSKRRRWGCRNQVTNLIPLVTIYFPWQIGSLLKCGTEECSHLSQHNNYKYPLYICLPVYACTHHYWLSKGGINASVCCAVPETFYEGTKSYTLFLWKTLKEWDVLYKLQHYNLFLFLICVSWTQYLGVKASLF